MDSNNDEDMVAWGFPAVIGADGSSNEYMKPLFLKLRILLVCLAILLISVLISDPGQWSCTLKLLCCLL